MTEQEQETLAVDNAQEPEPESEKKKTEPREYLVLQSNQQGTWQEVKTILATSAEGAIKSLGQDSLKANVKYVAVPMRNWSPRSPKVETTTRISFD